LSEYGKDGEYDSIIAAYDSAETMDEKIEAVEGL
jgi:hypothetical protein